MKKNYLTLAFLFFTLITFSQTKDAGDYIYWSATKKLSVNDFNFKKSGSDKNICNAIFTIELHSSITKSYNKWIRTSMLKSSSWIDTSKNIASQLTYLQTLFDIEEIYARQWRKKVNDRFNISGSFLIKTEAATLEDADKRKESYKAEISNAKEPALHNIQAKWEETIKKELENLNDYTYEKRRY